MSANEMQIAGDHYRTEFQHWDLVAQYRINYFKAQVIKYITRWKKKQGLQDLRKAQHFLHKYIELIASDQVRMPTNITPEYLDILRYGEANNLEPEEIYMIRDLLWADDIVNLSEVQNRLFAYISQVESTEPGPGYVNQ